jgi:cell division protein DivIC
MVSDFSKKQKSKFFSGKFLFVAAGILLIIIAVLLVFEDVKIYKKRHQLNAEISNYEKQILQIQKRNETLKEEIANSNNPDYIEKIAREEEGMQKPGEKVVSFIMPAQQTAQEQKAGNFWDAKVWAGWFSGAWSWLKTKF